MTDHVVDREDVAAAMIALAEAIASMLVKLECLDQDTLEIDKKFEALQHLLGISDEDLRARS
jgi:hypothetical protein